MMTTEQNELTITLRPTPNPNAFKFILNRPVKSEGSSTYRSPMECGENNLALKLFMLRGVDQVHFFDNVITITKFDYEDWEELEIKITNTINLEGPSHNPNYYDPDPEAERRAKLSPEALEIEEILDKTIRPGLQGDGGDLAIVSFEKNEKVLIIKYQGACGTCPSSTTGTLEAIRSILKDQYDPEIEVYIDPESMGPY